LKHDGSLLLGRVKRIENLQAVGRCGFQAKIIGPKFRAAVMNGGGQMQGIGRLEIS
jgi:hypothetical protein